MTDTLVPLVEKLAGRDWTPRTRNTAARNLARYRATHAGSSVVKRRVISCSPPGKIVQWEAWRSRLLRVVGEANGCSVTLHTSGMNLRGSRRRHYITMYGTEADMERSVQLYQALAERALVVVALMSGPRVGQERRAYLQTFASMIATRLHDITTLPSCAWVAECRSKADQERAIHGTAELHTVRR